MRNWFHSKHGLMNCWPHIINRSLWLVIISLCCTFSYAQEKQWVRLSTGKIEIDRQTEYINLEFIIEEGMHIQADTLSNSNFIPTVLTLEMPEGMKYGRPVFPEMHVIQLAGSEDVMEVFDGRVQVSIPLIHSAIPPGDYHLDGQLYYQACSDQKCFFPRTLKFTIPLLVSSE